MFRPSLGAGSLLVVLGLAGCGAAGLGDARPTPVDIPGEGTTFVYRDLGVQRVARPARYNAPLPAPGAPWTPADPPPGWVADALCAGDPTVQAAFDASLRPTLIGRPPGAEVLDAAARFGDCASPAFCAWATSRQADPDPAVRAVYALGLVGCADAGPTLGADGSFGPALVAWSGAELAAGRPVAWTPRLAAAVGETAAWGPGDAALAAHIARLVDEPQAAPVLLSVAAALPEERRADFVRGLADASLPELVALSCGSPGCEPDEAPEGPAFPPAPADPADRPGWLTSLGACARSPDDDVVAAACLSVLAGADRPAAVALAGALRPDPGSPLAEPVATLIRYPAAGGMWQRLVAVGLVTGDAPRGADGILTLEGVLTASGNAARFGSRGEGAPPDHTELLRLLAHLVAPALDGVVFEQAAVDRSAGGGVDLYAYVDGDRYVTHAGATAADWYDVGAAVGMVDALARLRGSDRRVALLPTEDQTVLAVGGPGAGLLAAREAGLLSFVGPTDVLQKSLEWEARVQAARGAPDDTDVGGAQ